MVHFTYSTEKHSDLCQGDVLKKTKELTEVISSIHPYFGREDYSHFIVLTQSCDLVRRNKSGCSARYITLAAVRSLKTALIRKLSESTKLIESKDVYLIPQTQNEKAISLLKVLLNNNDKTHFFLKSEASLGLIEDSCAFLLVSIAIKSELHYQVCFDARILGLTPVFQSKLGWLVGNLYSRVGTEDYPQALNLTHADFDEEARNLLKDHLLTVDSQIFNELRKELALAPDSDLEELITKLDLSIKEKNNEDRKSRLTSIIKDVSKVVKLDKEQQESLRNILAANSIVKRSLDS